MRLNDEMIAKRKEQFWTPASKFIIQNYRDGAAVPTINPSMQEWWLWTEYFMAHLGWRIMPSIMEEILAKTRGDGKNMMTVPHLNPRVFDPSWKGVYRDRRHELQRVES